jgi:hypothetical protein
MNPSGPGVLSPGLVAMGGPSGAGDVALDDAVWLQRAGFGVAQFDL